MSVHTEDGPINTCPEEVLAPTFRISTKYLVKSQILTLTLVTRIMVSVSIHTEEDPGNHLLGPPSGSSLPRDRLRCPFILQSFRRITWYLSLKRCTHVLTEEFCREEPTPEVSLKFWRSDLEFRVCFCKNR